MSAYTRFVISSLFACWALACFWGGAFLGGHFATEKAVGILQKSLEVSHTAVDVLDRYAEQTIDFDKACAAWGKETSETFKRPRFVAEPLVDRSGVDPGFVLGGAP